VGLRGGTHPNPNGTGNNYALINGGPTRQSYRQHKQEPVQKKRAYLAYAHDTGIYGVLHAYIYAHVRSALEGRALSGSGAISSYDKAVTEV